MYLSDSKNKKEKFFLENGFHLKGNKIEIAAALVYATAKRKATEELSSFNLSDILFDKEKTREIKNILNKYFCINEKFIYEMNPLSTEISSNYLTSNREELNRLLSECLIDQYEIINNISEKDVEKVLCYVTAKALVMTQARYISQRINYELKYNQFLTAKTNLSYTKESIECEALLKLIKANMIIQETSVDLFLSELRNKFTAFTYHDVDNVFSKLSQKIKGYLW